MIERLIDSIWKMHKMTQTIKSFTCYVYLLSILVDDDDHNVHFKLAKKLKGKTFGSNLEGKKVGKFFRCDK